MSEQRDDVLLHRRMIWSPWGQGPPGHYNPTRVTVDDPHSEWHRKPGESLSAFRWRIHDELVSEGRLPGPDAMPVIAVEHHGAQVFDISTRSLLSAGTDNTQSSGD